MYWDYLDVTYKFGDGGDGSDGMGGLGDVGDIGGSIGDFGDAESIGSSVNDIGDIGTSLGDVENINNLNIFGDMHSGADNKNNEKVVIINQDNNNIFSDTPAFDRLQWNKDVYHRWRQIFGPIEKNVADFYLSATPNTYLSPMKDAIQKSIKTLHSSIDYYDKLKQSELENMAAIGLEDKIAGDKFNYFAQGMNLQSPLISGVNQASNAIDQANRNINSLRMQRQINTNNNIAGLLGAGAMILGRN